MYFKATIDLEKKKKNQFPVNSKWTASGQNWIYFYIAS